MYFHSDDEFKRTWMSKILSNFNNPNCTRISIGMIFFPHYNSPNNKILKTPIPVSLPEVYMKFKPVWIRRLLKIKQACQRSDSLLSAV